ncbi:putative uncharacterized protein pph32 [Pseudomonas savastanoi pv. phaseolicola]|nr:putative uncharacterized protein pph32 [Pseudomonas amygdali pv. mellea]KPB66746.1 putative uncharacterized protein pph32 [Pseudomonas savastanoi pv. phaseolicola]
MVPDWVSDISVAGSVRRQRQHAVIIPHGSNTLLEVWVNISQGQHGDVWELKDQTIKLLETCSDQVDAQIMRSQSNSLPAAKLQHYLPMAGELFVDRFTR